MGLQVKGDSHVPEQMRRNTGFPVENTVYIELVSPEFGSNESASIVKCKTRNIARDRLQLSLDQALPVGIVLQLGLELPAKAGTLYLVGEIRRSHPIPVTTAEPGWSADLVLLNADDSDIDDWVALISTMQS